MNKPTHIELSRKHAIKELLAISLITTLTLLLASLVGGFEPFRNWLEATPRQLVEVLVATSILVFAFGVYSYRRWREMQHVIDLRERAEASLHHREEQYLTLLHSIPDITWTANSMGEIEFISPRVESVLGFTPQEFYQNADHIWLERIHPEDAAQVLHAFEALFSSNKSFDIEYRIQAKNGNWIWLHDRAFASIERDGRLYAHGIFAEIGERKRAEQALKEANERAIVEYDRLLERLAILAQSIGTARDLPTIYRDLHCFAVVSTKCNAMFISLYDLDKSELNAVYGCIDGKEADLSTLSTLHPSITKSDDVVADDRTWAVDDHNQAPEQEGQITSHSEISPRLPRRSLVTPMLMKGRVMGAIELQSLQPWSFRQEHVTAMQMAANLAANAIENVRLLEREREQEQQLRQSQKMEAIGQLAGGVAHDFNNLLTAITGYSELLLRKLPEERPVRKYAEEIDKAARRATSLTRQLLAFSRRQILQPRIVDLNIVVGEMNKMLQRLIGENIDFRASLAPDLLPIKADPGQLEQVIMNLVVNARDSLAAGGKITIETRQTYLDEVYTAKHVSVEPGHYAVLAVSDNGVGMDRETQKRIFDPFFTTKEMGKGTGLGLSTVYGIVKQSGGNIWVYSEPGQGTTFKIYLPTIDQTPTQEQPKPLIVARGNETILLVEDEQIVRELSRKILEEQGYSVVTAANGREALKVCRGMSESIDLLITDVVMPFMGGSELAEAIALIKPETKVIYMSGYTDEGIVRQGLLDPNVLFLQKPFSPDSLVLKTRELLDGISAN